MGMREIMLEKILGRETLCFSGKVAARGRCWGGSLFLRLRASTGESGRQNAHVTAAKAR